MYRSSLQKDTDIMPGQSLSDFPSFIPASPDSPSSSSQSSITTSYQPTFLERLTGLPMVRAAVTRVKDTYEEIKDRHELLRDACEMGEKTVNGTFIRALGVVDRVGLTSTLQKTVSMADSSACFVLGKVEEKMPIITKTPYEIKLMVRDNWEGKMDQVTAAKETVVRTYDHTVKEVKEVASQQAQAVLNTPVGQTVEGVVERGLTMADSAVDRLLPEGGGHSHKNGNGSISNGNAMNGHSYAHTNGGYGTTMDHAKSLSNKVKRRVSAKSSDVVDGVMTIPIVSSVAGVAKKNMDSGRQVVSGVYYGVASVTGKMVDLWYTTVLFFLPKPLQTRLTTFLDGFVDKMVASRRESSVYVHERSY